MKRAQVCSVKNSTSFPAHVGAKYRQNLHYGSAQWRDIYATMRQSNEGYNGVFKDLGRVDPSRRRHRGFTAQFITSTLILFGVNVRSIMRFMEIHEPSPVVAETEDEAVLREMAELVRTHAPEMLGRDEVDRVACGRGRDRERCERR